jgi:hypothetical protein
MKPIPGAVRMEAFGIRLYVPPVWSGRIFRQAALAQKGEGPGPVIVHGANFALPLDDSNGLAGAAQATMGPGHALFVLVNWVPDSVIVPGQGLYAAKLSRLTLDPGLYRPETVLGGLPGQVGMQCFFTVGQRPMMFYSVLGSADWAKQGVVEGNGILRTMEIASTMTSVDFRPATQLVAAAPAGPATKGGAVG